MGDKKIAKATKNIVISTDTVVVYRGTKRDGQCHIDICLTKSFFFACGSQIKARRDSFVNQRDCNESCSSS